VLEWNEEAFLEDPADGFPAMHDWKDIGETFFGTLVHRSTFSMSANRSFFPS
jgi:hypothetical protein